MSCFVTSGKVRFRARESLTRSTRVHGHQRLSLIPTRTSIYTHVGTWLVVRDEKEGKLLKEHRVSANIDYERQADTIITWMDDQNPDIALSFQVSSS